MGLGLVALLGLAAAGAQTPPAGPTPEQKAELERLIRQNLYVVRAERGRLAGPGAEFLTRETRDAQFVAVGEQHFSWEIPEITTMLFRQLQERHGFQYLALENGPMAVSTLAQKPYRGDLRKTLEYVRRYPWSIMFNSDQDLAMMVEVARMSRAKGQPLWGIDQEFAAMPVLDILRRQARTPAARRALEALYAKASPHETKRPGDLFMASVATAEDFRALRQAFAPRPGSFEEFAIRQLEISNEVYSYYQRAAKEPVGRLNNYVREENMKDLFMASYREAQRKGDRLPKVILKMGQWHLFRGLSPGSIFPTGNFVSEFAKSNGMSSFHMYLLAHTKKEIPDTADWEPFRPFLMAADTGQWTIIDFRPLRNYWHAGKISGSAAFRRLIFGFDALFAIGGGRQATTELTKNP